MLCYVAVQLLCVSHFLFFFSSKPDMTFSLTVDESRKTLILAFGELQDLLLFAGVVFIIIMPCYIIRKPCFLAVVLVKRFTTVKLSLSKRIKLGE